MSGVARLLLGTALFCAWFLLLMTGRVFHGAVHLLLVASALVIPWRSAAGPGRPDS